MARYGSAARVLADALGTTVNRAERILDRGVQTAVDQPTRTVDAGGRRFAQTAKYIGGSAVGLGGLHYGSRAYADYASLESTREEAEVQQAVAEAAEEIANQENLTPEEQENLMAALSEAIASAENDEDYGNNGIFDGLFDDPLEIPGVGEVQWSTFLAVVFVLWMIFRYTDVGRS